MRLTSVQIRNFRSISFLELPLDPSCRVLVGINESGKSNILRALASLGTYMPSKQRDVREPLPSESPIEQAEIQFRFALDTTETKDLFSLASQLVVAKEMAKTPIALRGGQTLTLRNFVEERNTGLYDVDVLSQAKKAKYWAIGNKYELAQGWKKPSDACPADLQVKGRPGSGSTAVKSLKLIYRPDYPELPDEVFAEASIQDLAAIVGIKVAARIEQELPETVSWEYSDQNLLPASIGIDQFASNPNSCLPLKNMFTLAGVEDIGPAIAAARGMSRNSLLNFFQSIAEKTTTHFRSVWKEYKDVAFELHPDGENLIPGVREQNRYDFERRSDGFKRFVSFLLQISTRVKSGTLSGALLLIDEPDISLHPSGARFLRDELIRISKSNYVVYSTHSIFMIDRENIGRHLIVEKEKEKTRASVTTDSNIADEEVIFNALGYSILEGLKKRNLLFEGWKDKHIFEVAIKHPPSEYRKVASHFKEIGRCHAKGVKHIKSITPFMELAQRECMIVSDSDQPARESQSLYQKDRGFGDWKRYDELLGDDAQVVTGEDFLKPESFRGPIKRIRQRHSSLPDFDEATLRNPHGKLSAVSNWLRLGLSDKSAREIELKTLKEELADDLRASDLEETYYKFLTKLADIF